METKICRLCNLMKSLTEFGRHGKSKDGMKNECKGCVSEINAAYYAANTEKHRAQVKAWQVANPDKIVGYRKKYSKKTG